MEILQLNAFSIGSLIGVVFFGVIAIFLFSVKERSKATYYLGLSFTTMAVFNMGYVISSSVYHPAAAFHRWLTVFTIFFAMSNLNIFYFYFPTERAPRAARDRKSVV